MGKLEIKQEELLVEDYDQLTSLLKEWLPKAHNDETAVSAVTKLMQQRENVLKEYYSLIPDDDSKVEQFRKDREERKKKTNRKFKK